MHRALTTRTGALTLAIILAAAAALMVFVYVRGYRVRRERPERRGFRAGRPNQTIPQLTPGNQVVEATMYRTTTVPKSSLVDGAVTNPDQLKGLVARNDVYPGEQLTTNQFVKSDTNSVAVNLKPNQRAIDFPADRPGRAWSAGYRWAITLTSSPTSRSCRSTRRPVSRARAASRSR